VAAFLPALSGRYGKPPTPQDNSILIALGFALIALAVGLGVLVILEG
jgi:hypothetical protein